MLWLTESVSNLSFSYRRALHFRSRTRFGLDEVTESPLADLVLDVVVVDALLVELDRHCFVSGHVGEISDESDNVRGVVLNVGVLEGTDHVLMPIRVGARSVQEAVLVDRVRQDVVIVNRSEVITLAFGAFGENQLLEVLFRHAFQTDTLATHNFFSEPKLTVLVLQD